MISSEKLKKTKLVQEVKYASVRHDFYIRFNGINPGIFDGLIQQ